MIKKWLCLKDGVVVNCVAAELDFMQKDPEIAKLYDSWMDAEAVGVPQIKIGSSLDQNGWKTTTGTKVGTDLRNQDLTGRDFSDCILEGCDFSGSVIDNCEFCGAKGSFSLVGAIWGGKVVKEGPIFFENPYYYSFVTDVFTVIGCLTTPTNNVVNIKTPEDHAAVDPANPKKPAKWWDYVKDEFLQLTEKWGGK